MSFLLMGERFRTCSKCGYYFVLFFCFFFGIFLLLSLLSSTELQIKGGIEDDLKSFYLSLNKNICGDPSLEQSQQDCFNDGSLDIMYGECGLLSPNYPCTPFYLEHCFDSFSKVSSFIYYLCMNSNQSSR